jgi:xanthine dehydrogenase accessory factor
LPPGASISGMAELRLGGNADELLRRLAEGPVVRIVVGEVQGSGPRDAGAWMAVAADGLIGTIGGGKLEFDAIADARALLAGQPVAPQRRFALGPSLGQCCGGVVWLRYELLQPADTERVRAELQQATGAQMPVALFGGGHVGAAIIAVLGALPARTRWIDSRDEVFPAQPPLNVRCEHSDPVQGAVPTLEPGSHVLIMSFSHAEDLDIVAACLKRRREHADLPFIGLIGSKSKWATFRRRLEARGFGADELAAVTSPIGVPGVVGKEPEVIAVAVAAQLMQQRPIQG